MGTVASSPRESPGPAWEIATLFPEQGEFSEEDYLRLTESTQRLVESSDGYIEVLLLPSLEVNVRSVFAAADLV
jgi:hypothetical protein